MTDTAAITPLKGCKVRQCAVCNAPFQARLADIKRGWAKTCSKSCAASRKNSRLARKNRGIWAKPIRQAEPEWHIAGLNCMMDHDDLQHGDKS